MTDETDINLIMARAQRDGVITHARTHGAHYGDYSGWDYQTALNTIRNGQEMFDALPSSIRDYFKNDPARFMDYVQDPDNREKLHLLGIANPPEDAIVTKDPAAEPTPPPSPSPPAQA
jgi:phage internal scaffolding protein